MSPDAPLLHAAQLGDRQAFAELYDRHVRAVVGQAYGVVRDADTAQDVAQEVFVTFWRKSRTVHLVDDSVLPWLLVTARFHALNAGRRLQRERGRSAPLDEALSDDTTAETEAAAGEVRAEIDKAVAALSTVDRRVYELCVEDGLSYERAARELGVSHAALRNRLSRVRSRLRADLRALRESA